MKELIIVGAGGFGQEVLQYARDMMQTAVAFRLRGFLDDRWPSVASVQGIEVVGDTRSYTPQESERFVVAVGDPHVKEQLAERLRGRGAQFASVLHPRAWIAPTAQVGLGCIIGPFATVGASARIDDHVIVNLHAAAGHDCYIGPYSVVSPFATVSGGAVVGRGVFFGSHAMITPDKKIGDNSKIAAAAVVYRDVPANCLATGNPATAFSLNSVDAA